MLDQLIGCSVHNVLTQVNSVLAKGIPIPSAAGMSLVNPSIVYHNGYLDMKTDFTYKPPHADDSDIPMLHSNSDDGGQDHSGVS